MANDKIEIPNVFNTPEYKERQRQRREESYRIDNNYQTRNPSIKIDSVNTAKIKKLSRQRKMQKIANTIKIITVLGCLIVLFNIGSRIYNKVTTPPHEYVVPAGYAEMQTRETVGINSSVSEIADGYYNETYEIAYGSFNNYVEAVIKLNGLNYRGDVKTLQTLNLPVLVDENNEYYMQIQEIMAEIAEIKENEYWIDHVVELGESVSILASRASGSSGETATLTNEIMHKNGMSSSFLRDGTTIKIINPKLGPLKLELNNLIQLLQQSLKEPQNTK